MAGCLGRFPQLAHPCGLSAAALTSALSHLSNSDGGAVKRETHGACGRGPHTVEERMADERFLYFAYGSNMLTRRLRQRTPSARPVSTGFVDGYRLSFRKASRGRVRDSGKCDIEPTGANGDRVYGVLFSIVNSEAQALRDAEGPGYDEKTMNVGTAQGKETAIVYIANDIVSGLRPYDWYKAFCRRRSEGTRPARRVCRVAQEIPVAAGHGRGATRQRRGNPRRRVNHSHQLRGMFGTA